MHRCISVALSSLAGLFLSSPAISRLQAANFSLGGRSRRIKTRRKTKVVAALLSGLCLVVFAAHAQTTQTKGGNGGNAGSANDKVFGGAGGTSSALGPGGNGGDGNTKNPNGKGPASGGGGGGAGFPGGNGGLGGGHGNIGGNGGRGGVNGMDLTNTSSNPSGGMIAGGNGDPGGEASNGNAGGGGGGAGGYGAVVSGTGHTYTNSGTITGGNGGNGGGGGNSANAFGGGGGDGGFGVFLNARNTLMNSGTITGGNGGVGGSGGGGTAGDGAGGVGVIGTGSDLVIDSGTISGGLAGDRTTRADAVNFFNGANTLELRHDFQIIGNAVSHSGTANGGDTLALGGPQSGKDTFDVALIGDVGQSGKQYQGFAQLAKTGESTWELTAPTRDVTYTIPVIIEGGILVAGPTGPDLEGTPLDDTTVALGKGDVFLNGGILRTPTLDPLAIVVGHNYTQGRNGTLQLGVAGTAGEDYDRVLYGGKAFLDGTLSVFSVGGFRPVSGDGFVVVRNLTPSSSSTTRSGRFAQINDSLNNNPKLQRVDVYAPNGAALVYVAAAPTPTPSPAPTPPPGHTPTPTPPSPSPSPKPTPPPIIVVIPTPLPPVDPEERIPRSFLLAALNPTAEQLTSMFEIPFSAANTQRFNLNDRMTQIRQGSTGFVSPIAPVPAPPPTGKEIGKKEVAPALVPSSINRWGVWVNGWGDWVNVNDDNGVKGYDFTTGGVSVGIDYRITACVAVGIFGTYAHAWTSLNPGDVDVNTGRGGGYATYWNQGYYVNTGIWGGYNSYDTSRQTLLQGRSANGSTEGYEFSTFVDTGYDFHFGNLSIGPVFSAQYTNVHVDGFSEHGAFLPLNIHSDSEESWRTDLGFQAYYTWHVGNITVIPSLWAAWDHEYKYSRLPITFSSAAFPGGSATTFGPHEGHDSAIINAGANVQWTPRISTYIGYQGQLGRDNYSANGVTGTFSYSF